MSETFKKIASEVGELVSKKNESYGNAFAKAGEFLKILYPDGVKPEQYTDMLILVRIFDKQMRIANKKNAFGESPYRDIIGYGILGESLNLPKPPTLPEWVEDLNSETWRNIVNKQNKHDGGEKDE